MCRLLGIFGYYHHWLDIVSGFQKHAEIGQVLRSASPGHKDGFGMARSNEANFAMSLVIKSAEPASNSNLFFNALKPFKIPPSIFLCHLRKASPGIMINHANAHPFILDKWAFIHNGSVYNAETLPRDPSYQLTSSNSDSELFFHYLLSQIASEETDNDIHQKLMMVIADLPVNYSALNFMLSDGRDLYVARWSKKHHAYYSLYYYKLPTSIILSSEPISSQHLNPKRWQEFPNRSISKISSSSPQLELLRN